MIRKSVLLVLLLFSITLAAKPKQGFFEFLRKPEIDINDFIADTLAVPLALDSVELTGNSNLRIVDDRAIPGKIIGIQNSKKLKYIPVDQYIIIKNDLVAAIKWYSVRDTVDTSGRLTVKNLSLWYDGKPFFSKGRKLNAYTVFEDSSGKVAGDWIWEFTLKPKKKQKEEAVFSQLMERWLIEQSSAIKHHQYHEEVYPYLFRRQLINWWDIIVFQDGYALNGHLTLDFPADQQKSWVRGSPGIFYRRGRYHESIAVGGKDQHWYYRINRHLIRRLNCCSRFGFNNFDSDKYSHLDIWNLVFVHIGLNASIEYRPVYLKGLFAGVGAHGSINLLPDVIDRFEPGILLTIGMILP